MSARTLRIAQYMVRTADAGSRIKGILDKNPEADPKLLEDLASVDPTGNQGNYINWLFKNVELLKDRTKKIRWPEDKERTRSALEFFHALKPSDRTFYGISQDISQLDLKALEAAKRQVHGHPDLPEFSGEQGLPEGSSLYARDGEYEIVKVGGPGVDLQTAMAAACSLGEGTEWCTRTEVSAKSYLKRGPLFVIYKDERPYAQFHRDKDDDAQLMDINDNEIHMYREPELFEALLRLKLMPKSMYASESLVSLVEARGSRPTTRYRDATPEEEREIAKSPKYALDYAEIVLRKKPFPMGEPAIAKSAEYAYRYAQDILNGPFPLGEPAIAKDSKASYLYAKFPLKGKPFPMGEPAIAKDMLNSFNYAYNVLHGRFPKGEPAISENGMYSYLYALDVLRKKPFPPGEPAMAKDRMYSVYYARNILNDPKAATWGRRYLAEHAVAASRTRKRHHTQGARF